MKLGMISCNYWSRIYDYDVPEPFDWAAMEEKHFQEFDRAELLRLLDKIKALGYENLELWHPHANYREMDEEDGEETRRLIESKGITPLVYCIGGWRPDDVDVRIERAYAFARGLGVDIVTGCLSQEESGKILDELERCGEKYGIRFAIENHPEPNYEDPEEIEEILDSRSKYIGANLDSGIYYRSGYDVLETARMFGDRIYHVHFKDATGEEGSVPTGDGEVPMEKLVEYLKEIDYEGMISIEYEPHTEPTEDLRRSLEYAKKVLA